MLKIGHRDISKYVINYSVNISDLDSDSSVRNAKGELMRDRISVKRKIDVSFQPLKTQEISFILNLVRDIFFDVSFIDPQVGRTVTCKMYVGDRTSALIDSRKELWTGLKFNLIER